MRRNALFVGLLSLSLTTGLAILLSGIVSGCGRSYRANVELLSIGEACDDGDSCTPPLICSSAGSCEPSGSATEGELCVVSADCAADLYCSAGSCESAGTLPTSAHCESTAACEAGLVCIAGGLFGRCQAAGSAYQGDGCTASSCMAGLLCDPVDQTCVTEWPTPYGDSCTDDNGCDATAGYLCDDATGTCRGMGPDGAPIVPWSGVDCPEPSVTEFNVIFELVPSLGGDFYRLPYPNNLRVISGRVSLAGFPTPDPISVVAPFVDRLVAAIEDEQTGFGRNETVFFRFSAAPLFCEASCGTSGNDACDSGCMGNPEPSPSVLAVDLTAGPSFGALTPISFRWRASTGQSAYLCGPWLGYGPTPLSPWLPGHTYAVLIASRVVSRDGIAMTQDTDFAAMLATSAPSDALQAAAWPKYQSLRDWLATSPTDGAGNDLTAASLGGAAVFTIRAPTALLDQIDSFAAARSAPSVSGLVACGAASSSCSDPTAQSFTEVQGRLQLPSVRNGMAPYLDEGGEVARDATGALEQQGTKDVGFALSVPHGLAPAGGWPLLLYAHAGDAYREHITHGLAEALIGVDVVTTTTTESFAVLGLDQSTLGPRLNFANPAAAKGAAVQHAVELRLLLDALEEIANAVSALSSLGGTSLNATRVALIGREEGAHAASLSLALPTAPEVAVLAGAGGPLVDQLLDKKSPHDLAAILPLLLAERSLTETRFHPVMSLLQSYWEEVDAANVAEHLVLRPHGTATAKHLLGLHGAGDPFSPDGSAMVFWRRAGSHFVDDGSSGLLVAAIDTEATPPVTANVAGQTHLLSIHSTVAEQAEEVLFDRQASPPDNPVAAQSRVLEFLGSFWADGGNAPTVDP